MSYAATTAFSPVRAAERMCAAGIIPVEMAEAIRSLKVARDATAHEGAEPTPGQAQSYAE
jgi:hypothetical protein